MLLSAYAAQSHRYWQAALQQMFPRWSWTVLELPPRYFSWRVRGNPLYWSIAERELLQAPHDLLIATSMSDLATLRGLVPALGEIPALLYFHENQFAYPQDKQQHSLLEAQMVSLYGALAADTIAFNSRFNRDTFLDGCDALLARLPDRVPAGVVTSLRDKSCILPVPLMPAEPRAGQGAATPDRRAGIRLLWSARFEHDKGGEGLLRILHNLEAAQEDFEVAVTGQQFRRSPPVFAEIEREFSHRLVQFGYVDSEARYTELMQWANVALSTALHEFQGLALMRAVQCGCVPVVPDRLVYREIYDPLYRYPSSPQTPASEAAAAAELICAFGKALPPPPDLSAYFPQVLSGRYERTIRALQDSNR
ncbi:tRNA-queuosine alpha-mannosyltransferase domain-containing protein [Pseudohalioglobus sediminis]|uniref:tRNA-queuosine alpha-mannosyltransferase domain-containing protein n=1 Tax=Pseudohalioglobus sediminis TaxID=2606449 RepID=UPI00165FF220|nr:DUF3524 domain-containing protein [Pseudohalioglobus sediminis]